MASSASSDEGEIRDVEPVKATKSLPQFDRSSVDRQDRPRSEQSLSRSPVAETGKVTATGRSAHRSRSPRPDRAPRGSKRPREDDYQSRDPRRFKIHYEDRSSDYRRRERPSYDDLDREHTQTTDLRYDDRERHSDRRHRTRSRSPYRPPHARGADRKDRGGGKDRNHAERYGDSGRNSSYGYEDQSHHSSRDPSVSNRPNGSMPPESHRPDAKSTKGKLRENRDHHESSLRSSIELNEEQVETEVEVLDDVAQIEQRRQRRDAIKAKYKGSSTPMLVQALHLGERSGPGTPTQQVNHDQDTQTHSASPLSTPGTPAEYTGSDTFSGLGDLGNAIQDAFAYAGEYEPSAADYDPTVDMREDRQRDDQRHGEDVSSKAYDETAPTQHQDVLLPATLAEEKPPAKAKDEFDMFAEDDDDMFAEEASAVAEVRELLGTGEEKAVAVPVPEARELDVGMLDNWDDAEGYYKVILGELLNGRYHVQSNLGRGMFSGVVRATDKVKDRLVAIKLIRNNETMRKAGMKEIEILQKLSEADPDDKKHLIRLERHFEHKGHLCMVFENLNINLREVLKKFGRDVGIKLSAVRIYAQQMFLGLGLMKKCNILHADLKPDNILVNSAPHDFLKICDLGSASDASENEITPYLVSRFYRAPEIILGMEYDYAIDVWSVGCTLYELYTGKILFTGRTNNQMLRSMMECRGKFTTKMLKKSTFAHIHFDDMANFKSVEQDKMTGKDIVKTMNFVKPTRDLRTRLVGTVKSRSESETKELNLFIDLLERCLTLNPEKRLTPSEALKHPFIHRIVR